MKTVKTNGDFERSRRMFLGEIVTRNARMLPDAAVSSLVSTNALCVAVEMLCVADAGEVH